MRLGLEIVSEAILEYTGLVLARAPEFIALSAGGGAQRRLGEELCYTGQQASERRQAPDRVRKIFPASEPCLAHLGDNAGSPPQSIDFERVAAGWINGRIEEDERRKPFPWWFVVKHRHRRQGMEYADFWLLAKMLVNTPEDALVVRNERCDVVHLDITQRVPTVISEVVEHDVETVGQAGTRKDNTDRSPARCCDTERAAGRPGYRVAGVC